MNILDAISAISISEGKLWCRPISWKGSVEALTLKNDELLLVPTLKGGSRYSLNYIEDIITEWEIVTPEEVLKEGSYE